MKQTNSQVGFSPIGDQMSDGMVCDIGEMIPVKNGRMYLE